ncbi:MAG: hypothetical protein HRT93_00650 [Piscirickettsiaceae bacterium]|nr:hypothetical protein [Piscirickettsiaceae bacterium]
MSSLAKHVIHQPKPFRCLIIVIASIVIATISMWLYLQKTTGHLSAALQNLQQSHQILQSDKLQLEVSHQNLSQVLETQRQAFAIQQATDQQLQQQVATLQSDIVHLNTELMFYQNVTQGTSSSKLQIRQLHLRVNHIQENIIHYRLVITQGEKISKPITGTVTLVLNNSNSSDSITIGEHPLSLRYVQVLEGQVKLADNVIPATVIVTLKQNKKKSLSKKFDWQIADDH